MTFQAALKLMQWNIKPVLRAETGFYFLTILLFKCQSELKYCADLYNMT